MASTGQELAFASMESLSERIRQRQVSPVEVTELMLTRIEELNPIIHAYYTVFDEQVMDDAKRAEQEIARGDYRGPLHGIPMGIKDIYEMGRTTWGSQPLQDYVAEEDCVAVKKLKDAGALILGKTATYEFAYGVQSLESPVEPVRSAWDLSLEAGGSSSGSAGAVAAGMAYSAMGSCTGGSIRWPAQCLLHVGLKATYGRVSRRGILPLAWSLDHPGPLARTVKDSALVLQGLAGYDELDPGSANAPVPDFTAKLGRDIGGMRIGLLTDLYEATCDPKVLEVYEQAVDRYRSLGAEIVRVSSIGLAELEAIQWPTLWADAAAIHLRNVRNRGHEFNPNTRQFLQWGMLVSSTYYLLASRCRAQVRDDLCAALTSQCDVLMLPTAGFQGPGPVPEESPGLNFIGSAFEIYTPIFNFTGLPAIQVPCGFDADGFPTGFQIAAKPFDEVTMFQVARAYEQSEKWYTMHPDI
ncbi:amidase [Candidatus Poriferisodalis sp.]|uniref:amidase n=1 Tax=Candidatus Poriferisodalis sp. TaxID=3101277 RepID=UPI003AF96635